MIDLVEVDASQITSTCYLTLGEDGVVRQTRDLKCARKSIVIPRGNRTKYVKSMYFNYKLLSEELDVLARVASHLKWDVCSRKEVKVFCPHIDISPFEVLFLAGIHEHFGPRYEFFSVKEIVFRQLLLLGELLPVEVRCEVLHQYLLLL